MEAHHDLRKSVTGMVVAESGVMLSSGREATLVWGWGGLTLQREPIGSNRQVRAGTTTDRRTADVGRLTPGAGIETSTRMGSDQKAAEALQEAETEVGVVSGTGSRVFGTVRVTASAPRRSRSAPGFGLTA